MGRGATMILALVLFAAGGAVLYYLPHRSDAELTDETLVLPELSAQAEAGEALFEANCAECHGVNALGTDNGPPLIHIYYEAGHHSDDAFRLAVTNGVAQHHWSFGAMPPQPQVAAEEVESIIRYVRELQQANGIGRDGNAGGKHPRHIVHSCSCLSLVGNWSQPRLSRRRAWSESNGVARLFPHAGNRKTKERKIPVFRLILAGLALIAIAVLLNVLPVEAGHGSHWGYGAGPGGWGWLGLLVWPFRWILWFGLLLLVVLMILRMFGLVGRGGDVSATPSASQEAAAAPDGSEALQILKRRFAEGEIDARQFESMKARLSEA